MMTGRRLATTITALVLAWSGSDPVVHAEERTPSAATSKDENRLHLAGMPLLLVDPDFGFAYGAVGRTLWADTGPTATTFRGQFSSLASTESLQDHQLDLDWGEVAGLPLRLLVSAGYKATRTQGYCGLAGGGGCAAGTAETAARVRGVGADDYAAFVDRYYWVRYVEGQAGLDAQWRLSSRETGLRLLVGWRGSGYVPGELGNQEPYPGSLYASRFPDGEGGFASVLQLGLILDQRGETARPWHGVQLEASVRDASPSFGSAWRFSGANLTSRFYLPIAGEEMVLANRLAADAIWGDAPTPELARVGGSEPYDAFGGASSGRGLRPWRGLGKIKLLGQSEVRARVGSFSIAGHRRLVDAVGFVDVGWIAAALDDIAADSEGLVGTGGGVRVVWFDDFVARVDAGVSPSDDLAPRMYVGVGNLW